MKTIGGEAPVRSSCSCSSNPLRPIRLTSSTRHLALARCSEARNSSAEPKTSTANASAQRGRRSARSTDRSSSITQISEGIVNTMDGCPSFNHPLLVHRAFVPSRPGGARHPPRARLRSEEHTSELQSQSNLVCRLLLEKKKKKKIRGTLDKKKKKLKRWR